MFLPFETDLFHEKYFKQIVNKYPMNQMQKKRNTCYYTKKTVNLIQN